jgi:hypothetical protein
MFITKKKHKIALTKEIKRREFAVNMLSQLYGIALAWKNKKMGNMRAISSIFTILDENRSRLIDAKHGGD